MLKSRWITAVVFGLAFSQLLQAQEHTSPAEDRAIHRQDLLDQKPSGIPIRIIEDSEDREARERSDREREQREKADLIAQEGMAVLAFWLLWVSIAGVAVSLMAVYFVWRTISLTRETLIATQKMASDTREIGEAQVRAYLVTAEVRAERSGDNDADMFNVTIKNVGNSPAYITAIEIKVYISDISIPKVIHGSNYYFESGAIAPSADWSQALELKKGVLDLKLMDHLRVVIDREVNVTGSVNYRDVFKRDRTTDFNFVVRKDESVPDMLKRAPYGNDSN